MEIQQHDGVVVEVAGIPVGLRQALTGGRGVTGGRGRRQGLGVGERSRKSKFSYVSPRSIYGETSNEGRRVHLHTLVDR